MGVLLRIDLALDDGRDLPYDQLAEPDRDKLKAVFPYAGVPAGVAIENGRQKAALTKFDGEEPGATLKQLKLIE